MSWLGRGGGGGGGGGGVKHPAAVAQFDPAASVATLRDHSANGATVMVACDALNFSEVVVTRGDLAKNVVWLVASTPDIAETAEALPLSLGSNFLVYHSQESQEEAGILTIHEMYSVKSRILRQNVFGRWSPDQGLTVPQPNIWARRGDLMGVTLVSTVLEWSPLLILEEGGNSTAGLMAEVLRTLQNSLNFRYILLFIYDIFFS